MKKLIGIDFSIQSPGICIFDNYTYKWIGFYQKKKQFETFSNIDSLSILEMDKKLDELSYSERERNYIVRAINLAETISYNISKYIENYKETHVAIEGFSFGSTGSRGLEIAGFQYILRKKLLELLDSPQNLWIFSPSTIKSVAQVSKKTKDDINTKDRIIQSFFNNVLDDSILNESSLHKEFIKDNEKFKAGKNYLKPMDDLIDSYFIVKTLQKELQKT